MGKSPSKNKVQREMIQRYGREVREVRVDFDERRAQKHKRSWQNQDLEDPEEESETDDV